MQNSLPKLLVTLFLVTAIFAGVQYHLQSQTSAPVSLIEQKTTLDFSQYLIELEGTEIPDDIAMEYLQELGFEAFMGTLTEVRPHCHTEAHAVGRALFWESGDLGTAVMQCGRQCTDGCFHGVVMGLFGANTTHTHAADEPAHNSHPVLNEENYEVMTNTFKTLCDNAGIVTVTNRRRGDCMHAVGHAALFLTGYDTKEALDLCMLFSETGEQYFCATGVYMERNISDVTNNKDNERGLFYPCTEENRFPAACYRYELQEIYDKNLASQEDVRAHCQSLASPLQQRGCLHGYGFAYHYSVQTNLPSIATLCQYGDSIAQELCVEGALGAAGNQIPETVARACDYLSTDLQTACMTGVQERSFGMNRDFTRYTHQ